MSFLNNFDPLFVISLLMLICFPRFVIYIAFITVFSLTMLVLTFKIQNKLKSNKPIKY